VGDTVIRDGWVGVVTSGQVEVTYKFPAEVKNQKDVSIKIKMSLKAVMDERIYPRMPVTKLPYEVLRKGIWSSGVGVVNSFTYRNRSSTVSKIEVIYALRFYDFSTISYKKPQLI
jgi:hypothetical protein